MKEKKEETKSNTGTLIQRDSHGFLVVVITSPTLIKRFTVRVIER